jgi:hypothetical protein
MRKFQEMSYNVNMLITVFTSSMLGTLGTGFYFLWIADKAARLGGLAPLILLLGAAILYSGIIVGTFCVFLPESRPVFKKLLVRPK